MARTKTGPERCSTLLAAFALGVGQAGPVLALVVPAQEVGYEVAVSRPVQQGPVSLQEAVALATRNVPGRVVRAETVIVDGREVHEVVIFQESGLVRTVRIDGATGEIL